MNKIISFGINTSAKPGKLKASSDKIDVENGSGKYLGLIRINDRHYIVTLSITGHNKGHVIVNEILFDSYMDGVVDFYYRENKSSECIRLEDELNKPTMLHLIKDEGKDLYEVLSRIKEIKRSSLVGVFENGFYGTDTTVYPEGHDFTKPISLEERAKLKREYVLQASLTGINSEAFDSLREVANRFPKTCYDLSLENDELKKYARELEKEIKDLKEQNERLRRDNEAVHK